MHGHNNRIHLGKCGVWLMDDQIGTLGHNVQLIVGDDRCNFNDDIACGIETGHFEIHPHEHRHRLLITASPREVT